MATDESFDELISTWLQETAPAEIPARVLEVAAQRTRTNRQQVGWRVLPRSIHVTRSILALGTTAAILVVGVLALSPRVVQPDVGELPTTPDAWSLASIDSPWATAQVDALVAGPSGLLAILGETGSHDMQLSVSTDGRTWRLVPNDQFPSPGVLWPPQASRRLPAVGTTHGFLFVAEGNDVWVSEDGYTWHRSADRAQDPDLRAGAIHAVVAGGPGLIAVGGDNKAWYSEDGSDWTLAEVPAPPTESFAAQGYAAPTVDMKGVAVAGDTLVAWGNAAVNDASELTMVEPVLWTSDDGRSWEKVLDVSGIGWLQDVAAGPDGFVAIGGADPTDSGGIWFSADGRVWQPAEAEGFRDVQRSSPELIPSSIAAASSGYVAAAGEGECAVEPCPDARAVIWTSPDGRSWSRLQRDDRFEVADSRTAANHSGAWATSAVAWGSHFVVAGAYDASPVIWISGSPDATEAPIVNPTHSETPASRESASPAPQSSEPVAPPSEPEVTELLNGFLEARVAGDGAEKYLLPVSRDSKDSTFFPPLLYATTSGARYERAEFEQVLGTDDWPDGATVFKVRLFAGDTMVEQLFFTTDNPDLLRYQAYAYGADFAPTTEDGMPVAVPYNFFEGEVTVDAAHPWDHVGSVSARLTPDGPGVRSNGEDIGTWDLLLLMADPAPLTGCQSGPVPADAEALAESIQSDSDLEWTAPVAVSAGGTEALMMDVAFADYTDAGTCDVDGVAVADVPGAVVVKDIGLTMGDWGPMDTWLSYVPEPDDPSSISAAEGTPIRTRLYLFDAPEGSSMRTLAIAIVAPESSFERAVEAAAPVVDSVEFHAP